MDKTGKEFLLIIRCQNSLDEQGNCLYLRKVCGVPLLDIMARRLKSTGLVKSAILFMGSPESAMVEVAKKHGWLPVVRGKFSAGLLRVFQAMLGAKHYILTDITYPLVDPDIWRQMASQFMQERLSCLRVKQWQGFAPIAMVKRSAVVLAVVKTLFQKGKSAWRDIERNFSPEKSREFFINLPETSPCLAADIINSAILSGLGGIRADLKSILKEEAHSKSLGELIFAKAQQKLYEDLLTSNFPHQANVRLNVFESENQLPVVKSFPLDLSISITGKCNANCLFCNYVPGVENNKNYFYLNDIKKMTWLKYVKKVGLGGGVGEPLLHPQFLSIFKYLKNAFPHLKMRVISNGILLNNDICEAFAGNLHKLRISLNAATKETWEKLMQTRGFENVCQGISTLARLKREKQTKHPEIILMMVVCRENICEVVKFAELAHELGAQGVNYSHFSKAVMSSCKMDVNSSLYFAKQEADLWLDRAEQRAKELELKVFDKPLPFAQEEKGYFWGERIVNVSEKCLYPWQTCYFGRSRKGENTPLMGFCCSGIESRIKYDTSSLGEENFGKLWNHPYLQYFRKTVNNGTTKSKNPVCSFCKTVDQADPKNMGNSPLPQNPWVEDTMAQEYETGA